MSDLIMPRRLSGNVLRSLGNERPTIADILYGDWVPDFPLWRQRNLSHGFCRYTRLHLPLQPPQVWRLEADVEPDSEKPFVCLMRHRADLPHTRMAIPWDMMVYETFELIGSRDRRAEALVPEAWAESKPLRQVEHPETAL